MTIRNIWKIPINTDIKQNTIVVRLNLSLEI